MTSERYWIWGQALVASALLSDKYGCPILAIEPSEAMLQEGQNLANEDQKIAWLVGAAEHVPADNGSVSMVWMSHAFHHIDDFDLAFREIRRALAPGGYLAIGNGMSDHIGEII